MLTKDEIEEINRFIANSVNPVFLFDNDPDGACAYLLLKKYYKKGRGLTIKSYPSLNSTYIQIIEKYNPDLIVILDKAEVDQEFLDKAPAKAIWIDHHPLKQRTNVCYYNPLKNNPNDNRPTTALIYAITKSNIWIAMLGCISDNYLPEFTEDFIKEYPNLIPNLPNNADEILYNSEFGKLVRIFSFNMKGKSSLVKESIKALEKIDSPYEILNQTTDQGKFLFKRSEKLLKEYSDLLSRVKEYLTNDKFLIFIYKEKETSFTSDLAHELIYLYPDKIIIIAREKEDSITMSLRSRKNDLLKALTKSLVGINGYGGGHKYACGASVNKSDFERFIENLKTNI